MTQTNILFFFPDQWRADWLGRNSDLKLRTPNIDKLQQRGMTFDKCWTPSPLCAPARACLASGKSFNKCGVSTNDDHQPPGLGKIDWKSLLRGLKEIEYQGPLMMELTGEGVKALRSTQELRDYPLEKEIMLAQAYLEHLWNKV